VIPLLPYIIHSLLCLSYKKEYQSFVRAYQNIEKAQMKKLEEIIEKNRNCVYLRSYQIDSMADFQKKLPLTTYEDYLPYIEKISKGEKNILTAEDVLLFEPTSGSTTASKLIPYTKTLKKEFQNAVKPWLYNLYSTQKGLKSGRSYWSITPAIHQKKRTSGGIAIGFDSDAAYFGKAFEKFSSLILLQPKVSVDQFYLQTAEALSACKNLTMLSVWHPSLLLLILDYMRENAYDTSFPHLRLISCWCDANAAVDAEKLQDLLPHVKIQPKGLLSTEAFVSFPMTGENGARLALRSHFFEFLSLKDEKIRLAHQLSLGETYEVIVTTSGGLYRYRTQDLITVTDAAPLVRFIGRSGKISDMYGEKLNELFVAELLKSIQYDFAMLAPEKDHYVLYIKSIDLPLDFETGLFTNFHYQYCRDLGQLKPLRIFKLTGNPAQEYITQCQKNGQRLGDIKIPALSLTCGWDQIFTGEYIVMPQSKI
jgi:hypothetical protein